ncbi:hypothetical protein F4604DRAFT_1906370 [Suillus subluteus]|nr:hypothetical protein F4604DRAFT_1906370 [Suillus subluteus]
MAPNSIEGMWGPGFIGYIIATALYGISFGQYMFYLRSFPQDPKRLKLFIMTAFLFDTMHQYAMTGIYWSIFISCRRSTSLECTTKFPWQMLLGLFVSYSIIFFVQCFYAYRVWIITGNNHWITGIICVLITVSFVCGMTICGLALYTRSAEFIFSTKWSPVSTFASALCDSVITGSIWLFMRPARTGNIRRKSRNYISDMMWICINMGLFSCILAITVVVVYMFQDGLMGQFYTAAPGAVLAKSYMNSMMTVLNARKSVREREELGYILTELPAIPTIRYGDCQARHPYLPHHFQAHPLKAPQGATHPPHTPRPTISSNVRTLFPVLLSNHVCLGGLRIRLVSTVRTPSSSSRGTRHTFRIASLLSPDREPPSRTPHKPQKVEYWKEKGGVCRCGRKNFVGLLYLLVCFFLFSPRLLRVELG